MRANQFLLLLWLSILMVGCRTKMGVFENGRYSQNYKEGFIDGFKTLSFCRCIENANDQQLNLSKEDVSCSVPDYLYAEMEAIDSLARNEANKIRRAEAERTTRRAEGMEGKLITSACLAFYNSKELSAIARQRFIVSERSMKALYKE